MRKRRLNDKAVRHALDLLAEARAIGELLDTPGPSKLTEIIDRSLALLEAAAQLQSENPEGIISVDEIGALTKAMTRDPAGSIH